MQDRGSHIFPLPVNNKKRDNSRFFRCFVLFFLVIFFIILDLSSTPALFPADIRSPDGFLLI